VESLARAFPAARFRRQVPLRHYIVDFARHRARLVIECDGGQHNPEVDGPRTALIEAEGYRLLRFWNNDILANPEGVHSAIATALLESHPHPTSPIKGEE
jgi:very-short-patch-repair endonuclease